MQLLTFTLNGIDFGMPVEYVKSIETQRNVVAVPASPVHVEGIMNLHGEIIAVYSLASRFGYGDRPVSNVIVVDIDGMRLGLEVETVRTILEVADQRVMPMPQIMNATQHCFNDVVTNQKELIVLLDVEHLVPPEERKGIHKLVEDHS